MKRKADWKAEAAWYQRLVAALVIKAGGTVNVTQEDLRVAVEQGIEVAQMEDGVSLRPRQVKTPRIITLH